MEMLNAGIFFLKIKVNSRTLQKETGTLIKAMKFLYRGAITLHTPIHHTVHSSAIRFIFFYALSCIIHRR